MEIQLLLAVIIGIFLLLFLILRFKIQAFLALLIVCIVVGIIAGMPPTEILTTMREGMGNTLGFVATVVGLGALFGAILEQSGGDPVVFEEKKDYDERMAPSPALIISIILIPIVLIVSHTLIGSPLFSNWNISYEVLYIFELAGHTFTALIIANLIAWYFLGVRRGMQKEYLLK